MKRIRRTVVSLWVMAAVLAVWQAAEARVVERIVAVVNDEIVLLSGLDERVKPLMPQLQRISDPTMRAQKLDELRRQALNMMIDEKIIAQQATKLKLDVSEHDLDRAIEDVMRRNKLTRQELEKALAEEGKSIAAYKRQILRPQLLRLRVLNVQVRGRVSVTEEEMRALYQKNLRDLGVETKVRARHIFVALPPGADDQAAARARKRAEKLLVEASKEGADFAALAKKHSDDPVTREDGGDQGYFGRGTFAPAVEDVVFAMKKGEIRGPLRTDRGFHIVKLIDRKESAARSFDEVKKELRQTIYGEKMEKATQAWLSDVRRKAHIDIRL